MKFNIKKRSLSFELAVGLILIIVIVESAILGYIYSRQSRLLLRELNNRADDHAANISEVLAIPIWDFDDEQIEKIGSGYVSKEIIEGVRIHDQKGQVLFKSKSNSDPEGQIERAVDITYKGQIIGTARLLFSMGSYQMELLWLRNAILYALSASLVVILVATGFLMRIFMRKPLKILQTGINRVEKGEFEYGFEEIHHDELSGIAQQFSSMAREIHSREKSLHIVNKELKQEIADRKAAEEKIVQSEAKYRSILEDMKEGYFELDLNKVFTFVNNAMEDMSGYTEEELIGMNVSEIVDKKTIGKVAGVFNAAKSTLHSADVFAIDTIQKSGEKRHVEISLSFMFDKNDVPVGFSGVVRDITERIIAEKEKRKLEKKLQRSQKMEALGILAGGVAHDLNNVLSGIVSYPDLLLMDLPEDSHLRKPLLAIRGSGKKAADIVMDLLALARRGVSVMEIVNLNDIIQEYLKSPEYQQLQTYHPNVRVQNRLDDRLMNIKGSSVHLRKTIMNLISNATEAQPSGGEIHISTYNQYVDTPIHGYDDIKDGDYVVLEVTDEGIGISDEDLSRIFEPFYTKKVMSRSGTGLGMAVVWGTVQDHNGYLNVKSRQGAGTTFFVYFPATREELRKNEHLIQVETYMGNGQKIVVVDDVAEQREIAKEILTKLNYTVVTVPSGEEAVEYLQNNSADLLLLDMIMEPGIDGLETYKQITAFRPSQKAIIASGYSETDRVKEAQGLGAGEYIKKPYTMEKIGLAVRKELNRKNN
jgi:PAS domain S-box-containing protein